MLFALSLGSPVLSTGCLVAEAPEYGAPEQTPPFINTTLVTPPLFVVLEARPRETIQLTVPFRSEDAGEALTASLWLDYNMPNQDPQGDHEKAPASLDDLDRSVTISWGPNSVPSGCHTLTLLLMHDSSYDDVLDLPKEGRDTDVASVTWIVNKLDSAVPAPGDAVLTNCPSAGGIVQ